MTKIAATTSEVTRSAESRITRVRGDSFELQGRFSFEGSEGIADSKRGAGLRLTEANALVVSGSALSAGICCKTVESAATEEDGSYSAFTSGSFFSPGAGAASISGSLMLRVGLMARAGRAAGTACGRGRPHLGQLSAAAATKAPQWGHQ